MRRITKALPTECKACQGIGYTKATCPEFVQQIDTAGKSRIVTHRQGSGCPTCLGTGQVDDT